MPVGGVDWQTLHYLLGLERLGFGVLYTGDNGYIPPITDREDLEGTEKVVNFVARALKGSALLSDGLTIRGMLMTNMPSEPPPSVCKLSGLAAPHW